MIKKFVLVDYRNTLNLGDHFQRIGLQYLLRDEYPGCEIRFCYRDALNELDLAPDEILILNGWFRKPEEQVVRKKGDKIVIAGMHFGTSQAGWIHRLGVKIGCRDQHSVDNAFPKKRGVFVGCSTCFLTMAENPPKVLFIDSPEWNENCQGENLPQHPYTKPKKELEQAFERLDLIRRSELVYTKRIHVAMACIANQVPFYLSPTKFQPERFGLLDYFGVRVGEINRVSRTLLWSMQQLYRTFLTEQIANYDK